MKTPNLNLKVLPTKILPYIQKVARFTGIIFIVTVLVSYLFLVWRINTFNQAQPSEDAISEKLRTVKLPKIDQSVIEKIEQLEDNSVDVQAIFKQARDNPFQE